MEEPRNDIIKDDDLKPLIDLLQTSGFDSIPGRFPKNGLPGHDEHIKVVPLPNGLDVCLKQCSEKPGIYLSAEALQHDINVLGSIFDGQDTRPVKVFGRIKNILILESIDDLTPLFSFAIEHRDMIDSVHARLVEVDTRIKQAKIDGDILGEGDPLVLRDFTSAQISQKQKLLGMKLGKAKEHAFVKKYIPESGKLEIVFIDPVR